MTNGLFPVIRAGATIESKLKEALDLRMGACAAHSNRLHALKALADSKLLEPAAFRAVIGQTEETIARDLRIAGEEFQVAKSDYEKCCADMGVPAYATWNED